MPLIKIDTANKIILKQIDSQKEKSKRIKASIHVIWRLFEPAALEVFFERTRKYFCMWSWEVCVLKLMSLSFSVGQRLAKNRNRDLDE